MIDNIKLWLAKTGFSNVGYALGALAALFFGQPFIAGACVGIFVYINFNVIKKIVTGAVERF